MDCTDSDLLFLFYLSGREGIQPGYEGSIYSVVISSVTAHSDILS